MSSGFGTQGKTGRCYQFWTTFSSCISTAENPKECRDARSNYFECLHHKKEFTALNEHTLKKQQEEREKGGQ
jgi:NADH dehydrogenase (ubiquinone) Fe-S protein 5|tara:strand:+ start:64 stop:279 length:216 start_codon:yes stop_codon:yes gene_type:complete